MSAPKPPMDPVTVNLLAHAVGTFTYHEHLHRATDEAAVQMASAVQKLAQHAPEAMDEYFSAIGRIVAELDSQLPVK